VRDLYDREKHVYNRRGVDFWGEIDHQRGHPVGYNHLKKVNSAAKQSLTLSRIGHGCKVEAFFQDL